MARIVVSGVVACQRRIEGGATHVLLICVDDLGFGDLGGSGQPVLKTPNIDSLAPDGLRLTDD